MRFFHGKRFYGLRLGSVYLQLKDVRFNRAYFSERYKYGCRHWTLGNWRFLVRRGG